MWRQESWSNLEKWKMGFRMHKPIIDRGYEMDSRDISSPGRGCEKDQAHCFEDTLEALPDRHDEDG